MKNLSNILILSLIGIGLLVGCRGAENVRKNSNSRETSVDTADTEKKGWTISEDIDPMDNTKRTVASLDADNTVTFDFPYGESEFSLNVRKWKDTTDVLLVCSKCQFIAGFDDSTSYRVKFDDEPPFRVTASHTTSGNSNVVFLGSESKLIDKLRTAKKVIIEAEFFQAGPKRIEFSTNGFKF